MKRAWFSKLLTLFLVGHGWMTAAESPAPTAQNETPPAILGVTVTSQEVLIRVLVPPGLQRVVLESRERVIGGTWVPRVVELVDGSGGELSLRVPSTQETEIFRVRGDAALALPASFYAGPTTFAGDPAAGYWRYGFPEDAVNAPGTVGGDPEGGSREVQESDIWRIRGNTLYFFNQLRGLQVIDLTDPDDPVIQARLSRPAVGEQMYVLEDGRVALLARAGCDWPGASEVLIVRINGPEAVVEAALPLEGTIQESRLVGTALYVVTQTFEERNLPADDQEEPRSVWEWGSQAASFDLARPETPLATDELWFSGQGNVISATDRWLVIVTQEANNWWQSVITLVDIQDPHGAMRQRGRIRPAGRVADKFKLNLSGDVLTVVSEVSRRGETGGPVSVLETFSIADPDRPETLGRVEVGHGESLFATRFDGARAYIVTFERIDPLWVIDLSDPRKPRVAGELEIPGWSTYIHPLGDRLVTVGIDDTESWKVAVQLFDVSDPSQPTLLSKVPLGENSSWSEANHDEKAFNVLAEEGLILVPYQGWTDEGQTHRMQLIDLEPERLVARGTIEHRLSARRATTHEGRVVSVSGRELVCVDATDRDAPAVTGQLDLAWPVDRLLVVGDYLVQLAEGARWGEAEGAELRVALRDSPETTVARFQTGRPWPAQGLARSGDHLFLLQADHASGWKPVPEGEAEEPGLTAPNVALTILSLADLPELRVLGQVESTLQDGALHGAMAALWPHPGLLVWAGSGGGGFYRWLDMPMADIALPPGRWWPWWGGNGGRLWAFDVTDPTTPRLRSTVNLTQDGDRWSFSPALLADGLIFLSHQESAFEPAEPNPDRPTDQPVKGQWVTRHYLDVVDFTDPDLPAVRQPVNLPGRLVGLAAGGALVFTLGAHFDAKGQSDWVEYLDASAYSGTEAALIGSLRLADTWPAPMQIPAGWLVQRRIGGDPATAELEVWELTQEGEFVRGRVVEQPTPLGEWVRIQDRLLARREYLLELFEISGPGPVWLGSVEAPGCLWFELDRAALADDLWLPMGDYGVTRLPLTP